MAQHAQPAKNHAVHHNKASILNSKAGFVFGPDLKIREIYGLD